MPVTNRGIWTPGEDDDFDYIVNLAAMAQSIEDNSIGKGSNFYKGTAAQRNAFLSQATEGDAWQDTNGEKFTWVKRGSQWQNIIPDTGWFSSGVASPATGWTLSLYRLRKFGDVCNAFFDVTRTGGTITVPSTTGNITNQVVATITDARFQPLYPDTAVITSGHTGRGAFGYINTSGQVRLTAVAGTKNIENGERFTLSGVFFAS